MNTGIRSATAMWLLANPSVQPRAGEFGRWKEGDNSACILGAACQAMGVEIVDEAGLVKVGDSWSLPCIAALALGITIDTAEAAAATFDSYAPESKADKTEYTWADALLLLPE